MGMDPAAPARSNWARKTGGWFLITAGIAGCVLPVIPGIPLLFAGLIILARDYAWARSALRKAKRKVVSMRRRARAKRSTNVSTASSVTRSEAGES